VRCVLSSLSLSNFTMPRQRPRKATAARSSPTAPIGPHPNLRRQHQTSTSSTLAASVRCAQTSRHRFRLVDNGYQLGGARFSQQRRRRWLAPGSGRRRLPPIMASAGLILANGRARHDGQRAPTFVENYGVGIDATCRHQVGQEMASSTIRAACAFVKGPGQLVDHFSTGLRIARGFGCDLSRGRFFSSPASH